MMTDKDLVELLRSDYAENFADQAADRIEELCKQIWQPIETAPKDGTEFDVWCVETWGSFRVTDIKWGRDDYGSEDGLIEYRQIDDEPFRSRWQECERNITHWMPKPLPPVLT
jgi:hypothetical protein